MAVTGQTAIVGAGATAFGAQSLVPLIDYAAQFSNIQPMPSTEVEYSAALVVIGVGGTVYGIGSMLLHWLLRKYHIEDAPAVQNP